MPLTHRSIDAPWGPLRLVEAANTGELDRALAKTIASILDSAVRANGAASIAVSGGKSPVGMFAELSTAKLDWRKVTVTLVDDRWLPPNHPDSNEALVKSHLLVNEARSASFIGLCGKVASPASGISEVRNRLACLPATLDVVVLGMGNDGHTASLFPCSTEAAVGLDPNYAEAFLAVNPATAPYARISMSLPRIVNTSALFLHIVGSEKRRVLESGLSATSTPSPTVQVLAAGGRIAQVYWCPNDA